MPSFEKPPEGPKIGPLKNFDDLSPDKKAELGDLKGLAASKVFKPAELDPRVEEAEAQDTQPKKTPEEVADELEALDTVLTDEPERVDPIVIEAAPAEDDKRRFLRATLGNQPYKKTYSLFDGDIKMKMIDLSPAEEEQLFSTLSSLVSSGQITTQSEWETAHDKLRMVFHMEKITFPGDKPPMGTKALFIRGKPDMGMETVDDFIKMAFGSSTIYRAAMHVTRVFMAHLEQLLEGVLRPDFWEAGGQDSQSEPISPAS